MRFDYPERVPVLKRHRSSLARFAMRFDYPERAKPIDNLNIYVMGSVRYAF